MYINTIIKFIALYANLKIKIYYCVCIYGCVLCTSMCCGTQVEGGQRKTLCIHGFNSLPLPLCVL